LNRTISYLKEGRYYILAMLVILVLVFAFMHGVVSPVGDDKTPIMVSIPKGANAAAVGKILRDKGLVRFAWVFPLMADAAGDEKNIKAGVYKFSKALSVRKMLDEVVSGHVAAVRVTIPEGFTARQIADRLAAEHLVKKQEFLILVQGGGREFSKMLPLGAQGMEGYLFPATYLVPINGAPREIAAQMLEAFRDKVAKPFADDIDKLSADQSPQSRADALNRIVTVASLIEKEAKKPQDRKLISAVIWNRLRAGMKLNIDATIEYALGEHRGRLYYRDLAVQSPYNTYEHAGLPPGPIANPGLPSIQAALHPAKVDYLYYVARRDGSHVFSRTLAEHDAAKSRIRRGL
jgi:UPF0755 protein